MPMIRKGARLSIDWQGDNLVAEYRADYSDVDSVQNYFQLTKDTIRFIGVEDGRQSVTRFPISPLEPTNTCPGAPCINHDLATP